MQTKLIPNTTPAGFDAEIEPLFLKEDSEFGFGPPYYVGIRNETGNIYRIAKTDGLHELIELSEALSALGFRDELTNGPHDGFDSIFRKH